MALEKKPLNINFSQGLDLKTDPFQVQPGKFLALENTVFTKGGLLSKRFGFGALAPLPNATSKYASTFKGNLLAIGTSINALSQGSETWVNKGAIKPISLSVETLIRSSTNQSQADAAIAPNGLICTVFTDNVPVAGVSTAVYKYAVADSTTGQNIVAPVVIAGTAGTVTGSPRVFVLKNYFIIVFTVTITATPHLQYIAIKVNNPSVANAAVDITSTYTPNARVNFDGVVANDTLYMAWNGSDGGGAIRMALLTSTLTLSSAKVFAGRVATIMSVTADTSQSTPVIYASFYNSGSSTGYTLAVNQQLDTVLSPTQIIASGTILNITSTATSGSVEVFYEVSTTYSYGGSAQTNLVRKINCTQAGTVGSSSVVVRSLGLASKAFAMDSVNYFLGVYSSAYQPTYFLVSEAGNVISKLAYSNAGPYYALGLPSVTVDDSAASMAYLFKDLVLPINKEQGATVSAGVYSQTGINMVTFDFDIQNLATSEIGNNLHLSGGYLSMYDGYSPVEHGFFLWPDNIGLTGSTTGGLMTAQAYYYQVTYEWADNQGNIFRSAPSIPVTVTTTGSTSSVTVNVPTLRLTYKTANPLKIVIYRWSTAQQTYYQVTSITIPVLNDKTVDSVAFVDTLADSAIIGNSIIYTTGGVLENIAAPATNLMTLSQSRLWVVDAEDTNLIWYSKQVIEATPVEMSDLLTLYLAPTTGAQGSTGPTTALASMDDKTIFFKKDAIYYITGTGPDIAGANNNFSEPVFITSTAGCDNPESIVLMPQGLMFRSGTKGIWLLGRDLSTTYIGAAVEDYNEFDVLSSLNVPGTNQVRFTLSNGVTLMYDYFFGQWGTFTGIPGISSTLYLGTHTYINSLGQVFSQMPDLYLDGSSPVLMKFSTSWLNLAGLQGFQRAYYFYLLGTYISPHKLNIGIAYDYNSSVQQLTTISPDNYSPAWGGDALWGSGETWGGPTSLEQWQMFFEKQKCEAFQITISESFDSTLGIAAGAGFTLSGLNIVVGLKAGSPELAAKNSVG